MFKARPRRAVTLTNEELEQVYNHKTHKPFDDFRGNGYQLKPRKRCSWKWLDSSIGHQNKACHYKNIYTLMISGKEGNPLKKETTPVKTG